MIPQQPFVPILFLLFLPSLSQLLMDDNLAEHHHIPLGTAYELVIRIQLFLGFWRKCLELGQKRREVEKKVGICDREGLSLGEEEGLKVLNVVGCEDEGLLDEVEIVYGRHCRISGCDHLW